VYCTTVVHRQESVDSRERFGRELQVRLHLVKGALQYSEIHLECSLQQGYADTFVLTHVLYYHTVVKLNRCLRRAVAPAAVPQSIRTAHAYANRLLKVVRALVLMDWGSSAFTLKRLSYHTIAMSSLRRARRARRA
jgi:hypothetical protein